jgi:hypothetical protein
MFFVCHSCIILYKCITLNQGVCLLNEIIKRKLLIIKLLRISGRGPKGKTRVRIKKSVVIIWKKPSLHSRL